ncbi:hypothetical protein DVH05_013629 [Phytophthora capsici]|nr:hypothetical protein DVH05_020161 [Phytophthora capsici]KAG1710907.1 hypothetical protein DVH05_013629 [Phytophthora capsici]
MAASQTKKRNPPVKPENTLAEQKRQRRAVQKSIPTAQANTGENSKSNATPSSNVEESSPRENLDKKSNKVSVENKSASDITSAEEKSNNKSEASEEKSEENIYGNVSSNIVDVADAAATPAPKYVSPLQRLEALRAEQAAGLQTISTVEKLQQFIKSNNVNEPAVRARLQIKGKVVWTSFHIVKTGELARIHIVDLEAMEPLSAMQKAFRDDYGRDYLSVDQLLITVTVFGASATSPGLPPDGAIVTITNPSKLQLFMDKACQLTTKLANMTFENSSSS